jgi:branched-chain amino acid transport system ATP-binding protein
MFTAYPLLGERRRQLAGTMSGGQQRLLSLAMAMMTEPRLLLLDELSLGLAPVIAEELFERVGEMVTRRGMSVLMVEQNVGQALRISDRAYVIRAGRILLEEDADALRERESWWDLF